MKQRLQQLKPVIEVLKKYSLVILIIAIGTVYGFTIHNSGKIVSQEPEQAKINEAYKGVKRPKIDEVISNRLDDLVDRNVQFNALLDKARQNPFLE